MNTEILDDGTIVPTPKAQEVVQLLESITGHRRDGKVCMTCGSELVNARDFKDDLSRHEFAISSMCQRCQDRTFGDD